MAPALSKDAPAPDQSISTHTKPVSPKLELKLNGESLQLYRSQEVSEQRYEEIESKADGKLLHDTPRQHEHLEACCDSCSRNLQHFNLMKRVYEWLETLAPTHSGSSIPVEASNPGHGNTPEGSGCLTTVGEGDPEGQDLDLDLAEATGEDADPTETLMGIGLWIEEEQGPNGHDSQLFEIK